MAPEFTIDDKTSNLPSLVSSSHFCATGMRLPAVIILLHIRELILDALATGISGWAFSHSAYAFSS